MASSEKSPIEFESFSDPDCSSSSGQKWETLESPKSLDLDQSNEYTSTEPIGGFPKTTFSAKKPDKLSLSFVIKEKDTLILSESDLKAVINSGDVSKHVGDSADDQIKALKAVIWNYEGDIHQPSYVKIVYGDFLFKGICKDFSEKKINVNREGKLIVAEVTLQFESTISPDLANKKAGKESPDMTHYYTVKEGETLPIISNKIYGTTNLYLALAKFNRLNSPRSLKAGEKIIIPPLIA